MNEQNNIVSLFLEAAKKYPSKPAIIQDDKSISFQDLLIEVEQTSGYFIEKGIKKGDRVLVFVPMGMDLYRIVLAILNIGATAVFLDEWVSKKRMEECCKVAQCRAFIGIFKARVLSFFSAELRKIPIHLGTGYKKFDGNINPHCKVANTDTALITFTTGSTGTPKAAKRTHGFLREQFSALIEKIDPQPDDIDMPVLPIVLLINLGAGCTSVIAEFKASKPDKMNPKQVLNQINKYKVNRMVSSPFFVKRLSEFTIENRIDSPLSLKKIFTGGAPVFPSEARLYTQAFPTTKIEIVYGSTEAEPISAILANTLIETNSNDPNIGLNVGKPYRKAEVKIIGIQSRNIHCDTEAELHQLETLPGEIGEIIVSGPHVLTEYFNNVEALLQNKIFIGSKCWHRTGDSGYLNSDGSLYLTGRCKALIYYEGRLFSPFVYENMFQQLPGVILGSIILHDNKIYTVLEVDNKADIRELTTRIESLLPESHLKIVSKIPRDPRHNSKIDYDKLKDMYFR